MRSDIMRVVRWLGFAFVILVVLATVAACAARTVTLTDADNKGATTVERGGKLDVALEGNASTGYSWQVVDDAGGRLKQLGEPVVEDLEPDSEGTLVGMTQRQVFTFDAVEPGTGTLKMEYKRAWETTVPAEKTLTVDVTVK